jgi:proline racemase
MQWLKRTVIMEIRRGKLVLTIAILMLAVVPSACAAAVIIDHTCTDLSLIPDAWIEEAKSNLHIAYLR